MGGLNLGGGLWRGLVRRSLHFNLLRFSHRILQYYRRLPAFVILHYLTAHPYNMIT